MEWVFIINISTNYTFWPSRFLRWVSLFWFWVAWGPFGGCWKLVLPSGLRRGLGTPAGSDPARGSTLHMSSLDPTSILFLLPKYAMLCPHLTRSERFLIPSWCFFIPLCTLETGSAVFSSLCFVAFPSWFPCSHSHNGNCTKVYIFSTLYHIAPIQNLLIFLHQLPSNCTLYCKKQNNHKCCQKKVSI